MLYIRRGVSEYPAVCGVNTVYDIYFYLLFISRRDDDNSQVIPSRVSSSAQ